MQTVSKLADRVMGKKEVAQGSTRPVESDTEQMRAVTYIKKQHVTVEMVPKPKLTHPGDVIVKVTSCSICSGSDSHLFGGEIPAIRKHSIMGHEAMGVVAEKGDDVKNFSVGDRVVIAFDIACGTCSFCKRGEFTACDTTNDSKLTEKAYGHCPCAIFGYSEMLGGVPGSQAEFVRVPFADVSCYKIPDDVPDEKALYMSDVLATSLHAVVLAELSEGESIAIWGLGPIGLCAIRWAQIKGASKIIAIDSVKERLELAQKTFPDVHIIDRSKEKDVPHKVLELVPEGVDCTIDAVGFRFPTTILHMAERTLGLETDTPDIISECFTAVRKCGRVSLIGDYVGFCNHFPIGQVMMKHLTIKSGQCPCQRYFEYIMEKLQSGEFDPTFIISHRISLDEVPKAYENLFKKQKGYIKVFITPNSQPVSATA